MTLHLDHSAVAPGELITGLVRWQFSEPPEVLGLRLVQQQVNYET